MGGYSTRPSASARAEAETALSIAQATVAGDRDAFEQEAFRMAFTLGSIEAIVSNLDRFDGDDVYTAAAMARIRAWLEAFGRRDVMDVEVE